MTCLGVGQTKLTLKKCSNTSATTGVRAGRDEHHWKRSSSAGWRYEITDTGAPISMPVGEAVMGRVFNVTGQPVDEQGPVKADKYYPIHRAAPALVDQSTTPQILTTGIKVIDLICPFLEGRQGRRGSKLALMRRQDRSRHRNGIHQQHRETAWRCFDVRRCR